MTTTDATYEPADGMFSPSKRQKTLAWTTHLFTASGAVWGLLAILAISSSDWILAFAWMGAAVFVDSFDGLLARRVRVKDVLPEFDGALLDNIVDFLNYAFVPAFFLYEADFLPKPAALVASVLVLLASAYQFCQVDAKTQDHYFKGFPSYWNIMVFYMFILSLNGWINLAITVLLSALVFVPIRYIYPSRTEMHRNFTMGFAIVWGVINIAILLQYPSYAPWMVWASLLFVFYYLALSIAGMIIQPD